MLGQRLLDRQPLEEDHPLGNAQTTILWSRRQNVGNEERAHGLVEVEDVGTIVVVVMAAVDLLQPLAELTSMLSPKL
jgi:hypothetical protein